MLNNNWINFKRLLDNPEIFSCLNEINKTIVKSNELKEIYPKFRKNYGPQNINERLTNRIKIKNLTIKNYEKYGKYKLKSVAKKLNVAVSTC